MQLIINKNSKPYVFALLITLIVFAYGAVNHLWADSKTNQDLGTTQNPAKTHVVVIDPGHGSRANFRENEGKNELEIALKMKTSLEQNNYKAILTHETLNEAIGDAETEYEDSAARADIANHVNADTIIRLHSDSHQEDQFSIYYPWQQLADQGGQIGPEDPLTLQKSKALSSQLLTAMQESGYSPAVQPIHPDTDSVWQANFVMSSHLKVPAAIVLIELYGHNNPDLIEKYSKEDEQQKMAETLSRAIMNYANSTQ